jgi:hypothetical protein
MPLGPEDAGTGGPERRRTSVVTRLVTLALVAAAALVVVSALGHSSGGVRARVAANTTPSVVVPDGEPKQVRILDSSRQGDAILLRVDPAGAAGPRTLVVSAGARVSGQSLAALLAEAADPSSAIHRLRYRVSYDSDGAIVAMVPSAS